MGNCLSVFTNVVSRNRHVSDGNSPVSTPAAATVALSIALPPNDASKSPPNAANMSGTSSATTRPSRGRSSTSPEHTVFISHAGEDKVTIAIPLRAMLREYGITAFVDQVDIPRGTDAKQAIIKAAETARIAVIVLSPEFVAREYPMKELMCFLRRYEEKATDSPDIPVIIPFFYRLSISELYHEPRFDRRDKDGNLLYRESRFYDRMENKEPEANVENIRAALTKLHPMMGVRNDFDASNDSSFVMYHRREILLQELFDCICDSIQPRDVDTAERSFGASQTQDKDTKIFVDSFQKYFPPLSFEVSAVLDLNGWDQYGNPSTPEGCVKQLLLNEKSGSPNVVSILGIGGVGKSTIMQALSVDDEVRQRFPDGLHLLKLGKRASTAKLFQQICQILKDSGAANMYQSLRLTYDVEEALHFAENWFEGKRCSFFIDDAWVGRIGVGLFSRLCKIASARSGSGVLITTREYAIASLLPGERIVRLLPQEEIGARRILFFHADLPDPQHSNDSVNNSINTILDICAGLPVSLAVAGKGVKKMKEDMPNAEEGVWELYSSQLVICRDRLLREDVENFGNLFATFKTSISFLDEKPRDQTLGFPSVFSFKQMHQKLCVLQKRVAVSNAVLKHLWKTESDEHAGVIATIFVERGLASREAVRVGKAYVMLLTLHDSLHDFAIAEAKRNDAIKNAHNCLLTGYNSCDPEISREVGGTSSWWSPKLQPDGYIHQNLCRHLVGAKRASELVRLLLKPQWAERQVKMNAVVFLEADFSLAIAVLQDEVQANIDQEEVSEIKKALQLISEAVTLSSSFIAKNPNELWFQLHGRLIRYVEGSRTIREYVKWILADGRRPRVLCLNDFLQQAGGPNTSIISVGVAVHCMVLLNKGEQVACGCEDGRIVILNLHQRKIENAWKAHNTRVFAIAAEKDGKRIISGSQDRTAKVWDSESGRCLTTFSSHTDAVQDVVVINDEKRVISVSYDGTAQMWNMHTAELELPPFPADKKAVDCVAVLGNGNHFVTGGFDCTAKLWNLRTGIQIGDAFAGHNGSVICVAVTPDRKRIVTGSADDTVRIWNAATHQQVGATLEGHTSIVACVAVCEHGRRIASGSLDETIRIWDADSGKAICDPLEGHGHLVTGVSFLEGSESVVSCSWDGTVRIWNLYQKKLERVPDKHGSAVTSVAFAVDGNAVVSGSNDQTLRTWSTRTARQVGDPLRGHSDWVRDVAVTPNDRNIVSVSYDKTVRIWDLESRKQLHTFTGHTDQIECVAITPQGDRAVTGSRDKTVRVWDLTSMDGSPVVFNGHNAKVRRVFIIDNGLRIVSVDFEHTVLVWEIDNQSIVKRTTIEEAWKKSRREVLRLIGNTTVEDDIHVCVPLCGRKVFQGEEPQSKVLATMESLVRCWALSPDKETICVGLANGLVALMKLET